MSSAPVSDLAARGPGPWRAVQKYLKIFRVSLIERMAYRGDFLLGTVLRFLPLISIHEVQRLVHEQEEEAKA